MSSWNTALEEGRAGLAAERLLLHLEGLDWHEHRKHRRQLEEIALHAIGGELVGREHVLARLHDLMGDARVLRDLAPLVHTPPQRIGAALFPVFVARGAESYGFLGRITVGWIPESARRHPSDQEFQRAVENARDWAFDRYQVPRALREGISWTLEPWHPGMEKTEGGSVGLAAAVAWASWCCRAPVPGDTAFTGCLGFHSGRLTVEDVPRESLASKIEAAESHGSVRWLALPANNERKEITTRHAIPVQKPLGSFVEEVLGQGTGRHRTAPLLRSNQSTPPAEQRLIALLLTSESPLDITSLENRFHQEEAWECETPGELVPEVLKRLEDGDVVERQGDSERVEVWRVRHDSPKAQHVGLSSRLKLQAHLAHAHSARSWEVGAYHLLAAKKPAESAQILSEALLAQDSAGSCDVHGFLERLEGIEGRSGVREVLSFLPEDTASRLVQIAWAASALPQPMSTASHHLFEHEQARDRLFTTQAIIEAVLHFLAAIALSLDACEPRVEAELKRRPSMGSLARASHSLWGDHGRSHAVRARIQASVERPEGLEKLASQLTSAMHAVNGLARFVGKRAEDEARSRLSESAPLAADLLLALSLGLEDLQLRRLDGDHLEVCPGEVGSGVELGDQALVHQAGVLFRRGEMEGWRATPPSVRYWSFDSTQIEPPVQLETRPEPRDLPALDTLVQPLAHLVVQWRKAGDAFTRAAVLDRGMGLILRLAWFPALHRIDPTAQEPQPTGRRPWLKPMNHRNLWREILVRGQGQPTTDFLLESEQDVTGLIAIIERLQHAPGPTTAWEPLVSHGERLLLRLIECAPWHLQWMLVSRDRRFRGVESEQAEGGASLHETAVAWVTSAGDLYEFGPWATQVAGEIWLLREVPGFKKKRGLRAGTFSKTTVNSLSLVTRHFDWVRHGDENRLLPQATKCS